MTFLSRSHAHHQAFICGTEIWGYQKSAVCAGMDNKEVERREERGYGKDELKAWL
jgi:hypothetical protein